MMKTRPVILVVDDQLQNIELLEGFLVRQGYEIIPAQSGEEALKKLSGNQIDLVLLDVRMPGMSGFEVLTKLRAGKKTWRIPVVMITANDANEARVKAIDSGCDDFISKPFDQYELIARVKSLLRIKFLNDDVDEAREFAESIINTVREPLISLDQDLRVVTVSRSFSEFFEVKPEDTVGQLIFDLGNKQWDIPKLRKLLETIIPQHTTFDNYEVEHDFATIGRRVMLLNARQIQRESGEKRIILLAIDDITELKKMRQKELEMKDNFLSHVSHELRTPLTVIHQFVSILLDGIPGNLNEEQHQYLAITMRNIKSLHGMIDDLLESSRALSGKLTVEPQIISLNKIVDEVISQYRNTTEGKEVILSSHLPADTPPLYADPQRTRQILTNLIDNAIKFSSDNCSISIATRVYEEDPGFLCVTVADNGSGIPPERIEQIFDHLYQIESKSEATRKGLGLGLYICKDLVSRHGGRIWAESQIGQGTTFHFTLPIFSYESLLLPILTRENLREGVYLLVIEAVSINKEVSENQKEIALTEVWHVLNRCVLPDMDVILPRIGRLNCAEMFFLAACTNEKGIEILKKRVRGQIEKLPFIHDILTTDVSTAMIDIPTIELGTHLENLRKSVSESVKDIVHSALRKKRKYYEENSYC